MSNIKIEEQNYSSVLDSQARTNNGSRASSVSRNHRKTVSMKNQLKTLGLAQFGKTPKEKRATLAAPSYARKFSTIEQDPSRKDSKSIPALPRKDPVPTWSSLASTLKDKLNKKK